MKAQTEFHHSVIYGNQAAEVGGGVNTVGAGIGAAFDSNVNFTHCSLADTLLFLVELEVFWSKFNHRYQ